MSCFFLMDTNVVLESLKQTCLRWVSAIGLRSPCGEAGHGNSPGSSSLWLQGLQVHSQPGGWVGAESSANGQVLESCEQGFLPGRMRWTGAQRVQWLLGLKEGRLWMSLEARSDPIFPEWEEVIFQTAKPKRKCYSDVKVHFFVWNLKSI